MSIKADWVVNQILLSTSRSDLYINFVIVVMASTNHSLNPL